MFSLAYFNLVRTSLCRVRTGQGVQKSSAPPHPPSFRHKPPIRHLPVQSVVAPRRRRHRTDPPTTRQPIEGGRPRHLERLEALRDQGRLLLAGPYPAIDSEDPGPAGFSGSLVVAEFVDLEAAREWANADPYVSAGVYAEVEVKPFKKVFP